jgi:hypothetical protein
MELSLDGPLPKLCPAVTLSHQDGHHSAVALLLKAALVHVSDYRLLGASGYLLIKQNVLNILYNYMVEMNIDIQDCSQYDSCQNKI